MPRKLKKRKRWTRGNLEARCLYLYTEVGASSMYNGVVARELYKAYRMVIKDFDSLLNAPKD